MNKAYESTPFAAWVLTEAAAERTRAFAELRAALDATQPINPFSDLHPDEITVELLEA
jgi:hypothetical protein